MNENVCIYLRKSRADREAEARGEGETLARHERILLDLAKSRSYSVGAIYREIVSGETISDRPVIQQVLREVEAGLWDGVLVVEVERLARGDTIDQGVVSRAFQYSDTKIITPTKTYDPDNEFDEEYFEFGLFMSRREYKTIKRRLNAGRIASVKEGKYCGTKPPYGYERIKLHGEKGFTLQPVPDQVKIVQLIYSWYSGATGERIGVAKIVRKLNDMGIKSALGKDWTPISVQTILANPIYIGMIRWNGRKTVKTIKDGTVVKSRPRAKAEDTLLFPGRHPAIISKEMYDTVQQIRKKNPPRPISIQNTIKNPLAGIVYCSKCGRAMVRRPYQKHGQEDTLLCPYTSCSTVSSKLSLVEAAVLNGIQELVDEYRLNDTISLPSTANQIRFKEQLIEEKENELMKLNSQKLKQFDLLEQGIYTTEIFLERSNAIAASLNSCSKIIEHLKHELKHDKEIMEQQSIFIPQCEKLLENYWSLDTASKNKMLKELIEKAEYTKDSKNAFRRGDDVTFVLDIFPRIQHNNY